MRIRASLKQKILSLIEEKGYIVINTTDEAIFYINRLFPNTSNGIINYLDGRRNNYIVFRRTTTSFDIGYRASCFSYCKDSCIFGVNIRGTNPIDIKDLL